MYNSGQKNAFLDSIHLESGKRNWAIDIFNTTENMEVERGVDLAMLSGEDVGTALCSTGATSSVTITNRVPFIVRYKKWCADNGIDAVVLESSDIVYDISDNLRDMMVCSPGQLDYVARRAFPDQGGLRTMAPVYRSYLWLAFSGMFEVDAVQVRERDINLRDLVVNVQGRWYELQPEAIPDIKAAIKLDEIDRNMSGKIKVYHRADGDEIIRGRKIKKVLTPEQYVMKTLRATVHGAMKEIGRNGMSYVKIRKSGLFYGMLSRELKGFTPNFYTIACDDYDRDKHKEVTPVIRQRTISRGVRGYKRDYELWKKAFESELKEEFKVEKLP